MNDIFLYRLKSGFERVIKWAFFVVVIPLIPLVARYLALFIKKQSPELWHLAPNGELLLLAVFINTAGLGDLLSNIKSGRIFKFVLGGFALIMLLLCVFLYTAIANDPSIDQTLAFKFSVQFFCLSLAVGLFCAIVAEV